MDNASTDTSEIQYPYERPVLKILGLGGGGCNAINRMIEFGIRGVDFIAANTDYQVLQSNLAPCKIQLGPRLTRGLGAGGKPEIGQAAAEESLKELKQALEGASMVFLTAGMGGGTGTGAIPIAAQAARSVGAVTVAIVTTPFSFEMGRRQKNASEGLKKLQPHTDTLITIPNDKLLCLAPRNMPIETAFHIADDVLRQAVQGITELITQVGIVNVDFAHIRRLMQQGGGTYLSIGHGQGELKALKAVDQALHHPLLDSIPVENATGIIANFTGGTDLTLFEVSEALSNLQAQTNFNAEIVMGVNQDSQMEGRVQLILVMTGIGAPTLEEALMGAKSINIPPKNDVYAPNVEGATIEKLEERSLFPRMGNLSSDLDIPAFLRRRMRTVNSED